MDGEGRRLAGRWVIPSPRSYRKEAYLFLCTGVACRAELVQQPSLPRFPGIRPQSGGSTFGRYTWAFGCGGVPFVLTSFPRHESSGLGADRGESVRAPVLVGLPGPGW